MQKRRILTTLFLVIAQLLILYVSAANTFPDGYIFAAGDVSQFFNLSKITDELSYTWSNLTGEGFFLQYYSYNLFYYPLYFFKTLFNVNNNSLSFFYYFFFLTLSFWSFFLSIPIYSEKIVQAPLLRISLSLLYTFNFYTFYNFYYIWGFSPFLYLYPLIPLIFSLTYKYFSLQVFNWRPLLLLSVPFFLSNIANGNMAFFIALNLLLLFFISSYYFLSKKYNFLEFIKRGLVYYLVYFLLVGWSVAPQVIELLRQATALNTGSTVFNLEAWILWQAVRFPHAFFLTYNIYDFFNTSLIVSPMVFFALFVLVVIGNSKKKNIRAVFVAYLFTLIVALFLINKGSGYLSSGIILQIFSNPIFGAIRSYDKALIFLPFILMVLLVVTYEERLLKYPKMWVLVLVSVFATFPFFTGGIQKYYSSAYSGKGNYETSDSTFIHKIPNGYFEIAEFINNDESNHKILRAPYNVINSPGWVNFSKWKVIGVDPTTQLFEKPTVEMNSYGAFGDWNYGDLWNKQDLDNSLWLMPFSGFFNVKYIIYHKDINQKFIAQSSGKFDHFQKLGYLKKILENDNLILFRLSDQFYLPNIYVPKNTLVTDSALEKVPALLNDISRVPDLYVLKNQNKDKILPNSTEFNDAENLKLEYKKINPTKFRIRVHRADAAFPLVMTESFHAGWRAYLVDRDRNGAPLPENAARLRLTNPAISTIDDEKATEEDMLDLVNKGHLSYLASQNSSKKYPWQKGSASLGFISKNQNGTIINNNLSDGDFFETWSNKAMLSNDTHFIANGYANGWQVDPKAICENELCKKNDDGTYDFEIVIEYFPQRIYYISLLVSVAVLIILLTIGILYRKIVRKVGNV